jgi:acyl-CoA thioester hydrolase
MNKFNSQYRVYYEDTDAGRVVYYANFLKFAERARTDFLRESGIEQNKLYDDEGIFFVVRNVDITYLSPGRLDDIIKVETSIEKLGKTSINMEQVFHNQDDVKLANMKTQIVCVKDIDGKVKSYKLPELVKDFFSGKG